MEDMISKIETMFLVGSELVMTLADMLRGERWRRGDTEALSESAIQLVIEPFGRVPLDMKEVIAETDSATVKLMLVNSFKFHEIDDARKYIL